MNRNLTRLLEIFLAAVVLLVGLILWGKNLGDRHLEEGRGQGYMMGYTMGYSDGTADLSPQDTQLLAGRMEPYGIGSARWQGFMMTFPEGYDKGYADGQSRLEMHSPGAELSTEP